ncbi:kinase-like protein [Thozetella sp. PMI_491]|nr:kinase-like protein [Thozetella sp. PMI_491]
MALRARLRSALVPNPVDRYRQFIPCGVFGDIVHETSVFAELEPFQDLVAHERSRLAREICHGKAGCLEPFSRVFAALVLSGLPEKIVSFLEIDISDSSLPFLWQSELADGDPAPPLSATETDKLVTKVADGYKTCGFMDSWPRTWLEAFFAEQWAFIAPSFPDTAGQVQCMHLTAHHVLPIVADLGRVDLDPLSASFDEVDSIQRFPNRTNVRAVRLHRQHYEVGAPSLNVPGQPFAFKWVSTTERQRFVQELKLLNVMRQLNDKHIIRLISALEVQRDGFYFIFHCATGTLNTLWRTRPDLVRQPTMQAWMARQCHALVGALAKVHGSYQQAHKQRAIRHGDLKPANILWFAAGQDVEKSELVITDFSHAEFVDELQSGDAAYINKNALHPRPSYQAPEDEARTVPVAGTAADIWTLGCTFLEFVTFYLAGWQGVDAEFPRARMTAEGAARVTSDAFYSFADGKATVKPQVERWVAKLRIQQGSSRYLRELLTITSEKMLQADPNRRARSEVLARELQSLRHRCDDDDTYYDAQV